MSYFINAKGVKIKVNPAFLTDSELKNLKPVESPEIPEVIKAAVKGIAKAIGEKAPEKAEAAQAIPENSDLD